MTSTKSSGLGDRFYVGGYDISGDVNSLSGIHGGPAPLDVTDITQKAHSRLGGLRDGGLDFIVYMDPAAGQEHAALSPLPRADSVMTYLRGTGIGSPAACLNAKQIGYDPTRAADGGLTFKVSGEANGYGLEWGVQLTAGTRTDAAATNGASYDTAAALAFGGQAYLQAVAFTGTDVTVTIQDSADNVTFANVAGLSFTQITGAVPLAQRIAVGNTSTIRRYVRAVTTTTGGFTNLAFVVALMKNPVAGVVF